VVAFVFDYAGNSEIGDLSTAYVLESMGRYLNLTEMVISSFDHREQIVLRNKGYRFSVT
jgi:hypothetical protein